MWSLLRQQPQLTHCCAYESMKTSIRVDGITISRFGWECAVGTASVFVVVVSVYAFGERTHFKSRFTTFQRHCGPLVPLSSFPWT